MASPHDVHRAALRARQLSRGIRVEAAPPDPFAAPVVHPTGVAWRPTDYRPIDQAPYREYAARRTDTP